MVPIVTVPEVATVVDIRDEIAEVKTFYFVFDNPEIERSFRVRSGQFIMCTVFGAGEFAVSLPFSPENDRRHISVRKVGKVTAALQELQPRAHPTACPMRRASSGVSLRERCSLVNSVVPRMPSVPKRASKIVLR
jgi:2-polyprenylphenol hydroxylase and related flavodoxin oxidoreductases